MKQYRFLHPLLIVFSLVSLLNICSGLLAAGAAFLIGPIYLYIGVTCLISGLAFRHAINVSIKRRYVVDFHYYRVPQYRIFSNYILWHRSSLHLVNIAVILWLVFVSTVTFGSGLYATLSLSILSALTAPIAIAATKCLVKYRVDSLFRIVVFRRNATSFAKNHITSVMPACGVYGQVLLLMDETLATTWEGGWSRLNQWVIGEIYQPVIADYDSKDEWKAVVTTELTYADFVVFDWPGEITENMIWELEQTVNKIPLQRIMILLSIASGKVVKEILRTLLRSDIVPDAILQISPTDPSMDHIFKRQFERAMNHLATTPRYT
jgi:hypothetical protein